MRLLLVQPTSPKTIQKFLFLSSVRSVPRTKLNLIEHRNSITGVVLIRELVLIKEHQLDYFLEMSKSKVKLELNVNMPERVGLYTNFILMEPQTQPIEKRPSIVLIFKESFLAKCYGLKLINHESIKRFNNTW